MTILAGDSVTFFLCQIPMSPCPLIRELIGGQTECSRAVLYSTSVSHELRAGSLSVWVGGIPSVAAMVGTEGLGDCHSAEAL